MRKVLLLAGAWCAVAVAAWAEDGPRANAEAFLDALQRGESDAAYDKLFHGSSIAEVREDQIKQMKQDTRTVLPLYGEMLGYDLVREQTYGDSLVRLTYLVKMEKHPLVWIFYFYRPRGEWYVANLFFNDDFAGLE